MSAPLLSVSSLGVLYKRAIVGVADVSLEVEEGTTVAILGANGAGKSTTLRAITGFIGLDEARIGHGSVTFAGRRITNLPPQRIARMGAVLVPERDKVFPNLTVAENLKVVGHRSDEMIDAVHEYFPRLGQVRGRLAGLLSGGERQMLAIGAALVSKPRLLLVDELSLGLAPVVVEELVGRLDEVRRSLRLTVLMVEQNAHMALRIAEYAYVLENGRVALQGTSAELRESASVQELYLGGHAGERRSYRDIAMEGLGS